MKNIFSIGVPWPSFRIFVHTVVCDCVKTADDAEKRLAEDLDRFWRDVLPIMDSAMESSSLHNVARFSCTVDTSLKQQSATTADGAPGETKVYFVL